MSITNNLGQTIGDAACDAILGKAIGDANGTAHLAIERADQWHFYSRQLEAQVNGLKTQLIAAREERNELATKQQKTEKELLLYMTAAREITKNSSDALQKNLEYGRAIQFRLRQVEKAFQHSSADTTSLKFLLGTYKELVDRFNLHGELPLDLQQKTEAIYQAFVSSGKLTSDANLQKMIDGAPLPKRGPKVIL